MAELRKVKTVKSNNWADPAKNEGEVETGRAKVLYYLSE